jgi:hypothetical protein
VEGVALDIGGATFSRRKMFSNVFFTEVVPAPDDRDRYDGIAA